MGNGYFIPFFFPLKIEGLESQLDHMRVNFTYTCTNYGACADGLQVDHGVDANSWLCRLIFTWEAFPVIPFFIFIFKGMREEVFLHRMCGW